MNGDTTRLRREAAEFNKSMQQTKRRLVVDGEPAARAIIVRSRFAADARRCADSLSDT